MASAPPRTLPSDPTCCTASRQASAVVPCAARSIDCQATMRGTRRTRARRMRTERLQNPHSPSKISTGSFTLSRYGVRALPCG